MRGFQACTPLGERPVAFLEEGMVMPQEALWGMRRFRVVGPVGLLRVPQYE